MGRKITNFLTGRPDIVIRDLKQQDPAATRTSRGDIDELKSLSTGNGHAWLITFFSGLHEGGVLVLLKVFTTA